MRVHYLALMILVGLALILGVDPGALYVGAQEESAAEVPVVYVIPLEGEVELGLTALMSRGYREAAELRSSYVVIDMSTPGGRVDAALDICDLLLDSMIPTAVLVSGDATSAGAIIAICAEKIFMTPGSTIGTAAPITIGQDGQADSAGEKAVSYIRAKVREYARQRGRDTEVCEAMVDADKEVTREIDGETVIVSEEGELLTLTSSEALSIGFIDGIIEDRRESAATAADPTALPPELLEALDMTAATVVRLQVKPSERIARFLSSMAVSGLLLSLGLLGIFVELRTPGFGLPGILGILCILLVFWGHSIAQLAGWEGPLLFFIGITLLVLEIFVTPGFGFVGLTGLLCVMLSFVITLMERSPSSPHFIPTLSFQALFMPVIVVLFAATVAMMGFLLAPLLLPVAARTPIGRLLILEQATDRERGYVSADPTLESLIGAQGTAAANLRPAGIARFADRRVDVVSEGGFVARGTRVEVVRVEGRRVVVRQT